LVSKNESGLQWGWRKLFSAGGNSIFVRKPPSFRLSPRRRNLIRPQETSRSKTRHEVTEMQVRKPTSFRRSPI